MPIIEKNGNLTFDMHNVRAGLCCGFVRAALRDVSVANKIYDFNDDEAIYIAVQLECIFFNRHKSIKMSLAAEPVAEIFDNRINDIKKSWHCEKSKLVKQVGFKPMKVNRAVARDI